MLIFLTTCLLFSVAVAIQIILWKVRLPKRQMRTLLLILGAVFLVWFIVAAALAEPLLELLHVALFYASVSLAYTVTYSAIEADSPTLSLMRFLAGGPREGAPEEEIAAFFAKRPFVRARLVALERSGLIGERDGRYVLAGKPSLAFRLILGYRKIYGSIPKGG